MLSTKLFSSDNSSGAGNDLLTSKLFPIFFHEPFETHSYLFITMQWYLMLLCSCSASSAALCLFSDLCCCVVCSLTLLCYCALILLCYCSLCAALLLPLFCSPLARKGAGNESLECVVPTLESCLLYRVSVPFS